jgi:phospholipid-binding lipoprotein MlaA
MKNPILVLPLLLLVLATGCATRQKGPEASAAAGQTGMGDGKAAATSDDGADEYAVAGVSDPLEPLNRATFMLNHGVYTVLLRPISKGYETVVPKPLRKGIHNAYENVKFPVRFVNSTLQGDFKRAGQETGKFLVNTVAGVGGVMTPSEKIPALAGLPTVDTGQTFARWGIGNGPYLVLPLLGPSTIRDTVGLAGDFALNPVSWVSFVYGGYAWTIAIPAANTMRSLPNQMAQYDAATKDALDAYIAARASYIQYRTGIAKKNRTPRSTVRVPAPAQ